MPISDKQLAPMVPAGIRVDEVGQIVRRFFCKPLQMNGECTIGCEQCKLMLSKQLPRIAAPEVVNPYALLTFLMRDERAKIIEGRAKTEAKDNWRDANPFEMFLTQL